MINAVVLAATGVNGDGHREVLGLQVATSETRSAWKTFFADLVARGLTGVRLVTSYAHAGLVEAIAANPARSQLAALQNPLLSQPHGRHPEESLASGQSDAALGYDQPDAASVEAQFDRLLDYTSEKLPEVAKHLEQARADVLAFTSFPKDVWTQS